MSVNSNGANYAPLKQALTDSDSEEDHKLENDIHMRSTASCNNFDINSGLHSSKNYSISDMEDLNTNINTAESSMDSVSFLQSDISNKMSFARRCAFVASIVACFLTVVVFMWGIPCSDVGSCPKNEWKDKTTSWELPYEDIELSGSVQVVDGVMPNTKNLIFIYRGNHMREADKSNDNSNGVLLIVGNSGKVGWYTREKKIPTKINCYIIDVNRDKQKDCIVAGSKGLLAALNSLSGTYYWNIHKNGQEFTNLAAIDFPIVIKDMDKDKINDLLSVATVLPNTNHNSMLMVSGATGNVIGAPVIIDDCVSVKLLPESDTVNLTYICKNGTAEAVRMISLQQLFKKLMQVDVSLDNHIHSGIKLKNINLSLKKSIGNTRESYSNGLGKLIIENSGECPDTCRVHIKLLLEKNGVSNISWEYTANHVFAMKPSSFAFANSIRGFVLKL